MQKCLSHHLFATIFSAIHMAEIPPGCKPEQKSLTAEITLRSILCTFWIYLGLSQIWSCDTNPSKSLCVSLLTKIQTYALFFVRKLLIFCLQLRCGCKKAELGKGGFQSSFKYKQEV